MASDLSVTHWIACLKASDAEAAERLWARYFQRLVGLARTHLGTSAGGGGDEEDVAQSVFKSLCLGANRGKFPQLIDRENLWTLVVAMTAYKSRDVIRRERCLKRGGGRVLDEAGLAGSGDSLGAIEDLVGREPTPEFSVQMAEQCERLLAMLNDVERQVAQLKLQGFTNQEIADQLDCGLRTVERRLDAVRRTWTIPS